MNNLEEVAPEDEQRTYRQAVPLAGSHRLRRARHEHPGRRVLFFLVFAFAGYYEYDTQIRSVQRRLGRRQRGHRPGDRLLSIAGVPIERWEDVPDTVRPTPGETVEVVYRARGRPDADLGAGRRSRDQSDGEACSA